VPRLAIIRQIYFLPGREHEGAGWLTDTEPRRRDAGQIAQWVLRGQIDTHEFVWIQVWSSYEAYDNWRRSGDRERFVAERARYMTHQPTRMFDLLE